VLKKIFRSADAPGTARREQEVLSRARPGMDVLRALYAGRVNCPPEKYLSLIYGILFS